jgi:photoactive yellow protein
MPNDKHPAFDQVDLIRNLEALGDSQFDDLEFGVIGFDAQAVVRRYSATESRQSGLERQDVLGLHLFGVVAQCFNNFLVAQRFEDAAAAGRALDATIDFVLTLRMRPTPVRLRLLADPAARMNYVCIQRRT